MNSASERHTELREYVPLKQGLRRYETSFLTTIYTLREYVPLKQGLRLAIPPRLEGGASLREYVPLKQGLRRFFIVFNLSMRLSPRVCSTKTRIKT